MQKEGGDAKVIGEILEMFGVSLGLTIVLELLVLLFLKEYSKENARLLILVNVLTNPPTVLLVWLVGQYFPEIHKIAVQVPPELLVVWTEAFIYRSFVENNGWKIKRPVLLAVAANAVSGTGVLLQNL